ncbi:MAG: ABC transporter substrate-binding protein [Chloroflexi bacterium]|nr:ABC transporter substrate-binding protein [Chloroflexota bacterium]
MKALKLLLCMILTFTLIVSCSPAAETPVTEAPAEETAPTEAASAEEVAPTEAAPAEAAEVAEADKFGGTLTFGIETEPPGFNPIQHDNWYEIWIYATSNQPLTHGGENFGTEWRPILAESWETSEDGLVWTIHLREGVTWQDGTPFTADDVLYWAEAIESPDTVDVDWVQNRFMVNDVPHKFEKVDDYTVTVTTAAPVPNLMADICVPVIPKHYFVDNDVAFADMDKSKFNTDNELLGTGPFRITEYRRGEAVIMDKYADYWGGEPYLDQIIYRIIPDRAALLTAMKTGEVDYVSLDPNEVEQLADAENVTIYRYPGDNAYHFRLNTLKPNLADKRTRQAMMYALDRQAFVDTLLLGYGTVADSTFSPYVTAYKPLDTTYTYDPEKAKALLAEVGWVPGADGFLVAENVEGVEAGAKLTIQIEVTSSSKMQPSLLAQSYWQAVGIDAQIRQRDNNVFKDLNYNVPAAERDFDVFWTSIGSAGPNGTAYNWLMANTNADDTIMGYINEDVNDLFDQAKVTDDAAERDEFLNEAANMVWDDLPFLNVYYQENLYAINKRVHFDEDNLDPTMWVQFVDFSKVWVDK